VYSKTRYFLHKGIKDDIKPIFLHHRSAFCKKKKKKRLAVSARKKRIQSLEGQGGKNSRRNSRAEVEKGQLERLKDTGSDDNTNEEDNAEDAVGIRLLRRVALLLPYQSSTSPGGYINQFLLESLFVGLEVCKQVY
jgi:hypothetical protein